MPAELHICLTEILRKIQAGRPAVSARWSESHVIRLIEINRQIQDRESEYRTLLDMLDFKFQGVLQQSTEQNLEIVSTFAVEIRHILEQFRNTTLHVLAAHATSVHRELLEAYKMEAALVALSQQRREWFSTKIKKYRGKTMPQRVRNFAKALGIDARTLTKIKSGQPIRPSKVTQIHEIDSSFPQGN